MTTPQPSRPRATPQPPLRHGLAPADDVDADGRGGDVASANGGLRRICLLVGLSALELEHVEHRLLATRRTIGRGERLYHAGNPFAAVYEVWTGFFKTCISVRDGRNQVTGFHMGGELVGMDGIASGRHDVDAVALENSQVCVIPFEELQALAQEVPALGHELHKVMGREIVRNQDAMMQLGSMHAEERLAAFLLNLALRLQASGFSATTLLLHMTRDEIGSFLGLTLETVSRTFSKFQAEGLLVVNNRHIRIADAAGLQQVLDGARVQ